MLFLQSFKMTKYTDKGRHVFLVIHISMIRLRTVNKYIHLLLYEKQTLVRSISMSVFQSLTETSS
jgi:hypothetical protein